MGRRRGEIEVVLRRCIYGGRCPGTVILVVDRESPTGVMGLEVSRVRRVTQTHLVLDDGTLIPLHRVIGISDSKGNITWLRPGSGRPTPRRPPG